MIFFFKISIKFQQYEIKPAKNIYKYDNILLKSLQETERCQWAQRKTKENEKVEA